MSYKVVCSVIYELVAMLMMAIQFNMKVRYVKIKRTFVRSIFADFVLSRAINFGQNVLRLPQNRAIFTSTHLHHFLDKKSKR
jgi:hypothetical protein